MTDYTGCICSWPKKDTSFICNILYKDRYHIGLILKYDTLNPRNSIILYNNDIIEYLGVISILHNIEEIFINNRLRYRYPELLYIDMNGEYHLTIYGRYLLPYHSNKVITILISDGYIISMDSFLIPSIISILGTYIWNIKVGIILGSSLYMYNHMNCIYLYNITDIIQVMNR